MNLKQKIAIPVAILLVLGTGALLYLTSLSNLSTNSNSAAFAEMADGIIVTCQDAEYRPTCYDEEIPKLMDRGFSMEDAFEVTRIIQHEDKEYPYCHVLGHYLSAKETAKDPSKWKDVVARVPSGVCSNGGVHGAFQERFRAESLPDASVEDLREELEGICEARKGWDPTPLEQATCTHALGHLSMYVTDANMQKSLDLCDEIALNKDGRDFRQLCYDGAFMQIFQPLEPDDFALIAGKEIGSKEEAVSFCSQFEDNYKTSCVGESWPLSFEEIKKPEGLVAHCSVLSDLPSGRDRCETGLFYVLAALNGLSKDWATEYCPGLPERLMGKCFANTASRMIEVDWQNIDMALEVCSIADTFNVGAACYDEMVLYSDYNFHSGSEEFFEICNSLPEPWRNQCLGG